MKIPQLGAVLVLLAACAAPRFPESADGYSRIDEPKDWLVDPDSFRATLKVAASEIVMQNGLVRRVWQVKPGAACVSLDDLVSGASLIRAVEPEAALVLDGTHYDVGGLQGQPDRAFLTPEWLAAMQPIEGAFQLVEVHQVGTRERMDWKRVRHTAPGAAWPPPGVGLVLDFAAPEGSAHAGVIVRVHYELYDGLPVFSKWVEVVNGSGREVELDRLTTERLAIVEDSNWVEARDGVARPVPRTLHVETDYAFGGFVPENAMRSVVTWRADPAFGTQVNYQKVTPCLLVVEPERGPDVLLAAGETLSSLRAFELVQDSTDRERQGLARRRMLRAMAPWVTENPLILHVVSSDPAVVKTAIDQAHECGFEMVSLSFGSGLNMEDESDANLAKFKGLVDYAAARGIELGGYSLLASRRIAPDGDNCINAETGKPGGQTFGFAPALASAWGTEYLRKLRQFFDATGFMQFTHDGSYPGDWDAAERPPLQRGLDDSQWVQWKLITGFYQELRAKGVYLRVPDYYYLAGSNECGMGYRETNWSLPRAQQVLHTRQNIYDGTWTKAPSMGWMFVPLTQYHGGGEAATIEPLDEHRDHYAAMLASNLGLGVQAVYRGHRLYDTERVRDLVSAWVAWYKAHRDILESDVVHGRRADGRDVDWMLHVGPELDERGLLVVFNPLDEDVTRTLRVPLHYTGIRGSAMVARGEGPGPAGASEEVALTADGSLVLEVPVPAGGMSWFVLR